MKKFLPLILILGLFGGSTEAAPVTVAFTGSITSVSGVNPGINVGESITLTVGYDTDVTTLPPGTPHFASTNAFTIDVVTANWVYAFLNNDTTFEIYDDDLVGAGLYFDQFIADSVNATGNDQIGGQDIVGGRVNFEKQVHYEPGPLPDILVPMIIDGPMPTDLHFPDSVSINFGVINIGVNLPEVPIPGAVWLFGSALGLLGWMRRKKAS